MMRISKYTGPEIGPIATWNGFGVDDPLHHEAVAEPIKGPWAEGIPMVSRAGERHIDHRPPEGGRELRGSAPRTFRDEGVPPHPIEVLDYPPDPLLAPEDHRGDLGGREALHRVEDDLAPTHDRRVAGAVHQSVERLGLSLGDFPDTEHRRRVAPPPESTMPRVVRKP